MNYIFKYLVLYISVSFIDVVKAESGCIYDENGWFKYHEIPLPWQEAVLYCQLRGSILASPTTPEIRNIMKEKSSKHDIFTGISSIMSKGDYYSLDGTPLSSIPHTWFGLQPDNKNDAERCVSLNSDGYILDIPCYEPRPFMCYRKQEYNICGTLDPEYHHDNRTDKCYKFHTIPKDFFQAYFLCSIEGGRLAIVNSEVESKVISGIFAKYPADKIIGDVWKNHAFVGFYYLDNSKTWTTIQGQSIQDAGFSKFAPGEPSSPGRENCGSVDRNGLLNDLNCAVKHAFICEKDLNLPSLCNNSKQK